MLLAKYTVPYSSCFLEITRVSLEKSEGAQEAPPFLMQFINWLKNSCKNLCAQAGIRFLMFWQFFPGYCSHCTIPIHHCKLSRVSIYQTLRTVHTMFCFFWYYVNQDRHQRGGVAFSFGPRDRRTFSRGPDVHNVCLYLALHGTNTACALFLLWTVF